MDLDLNGVIGSGSFDHAVCLPIRMNWSNYIMNLLLVLQAVDPRQLSLTLTITVNLHFTESSAPYLV